MFKVGEIVKYSPKFCGAGEEYYIHEVKEVNPDTKKCLIVTLNSLLTLGASERVDFDMITPAKKYEIILDRNANDRKYLITDTTTKEFFSGYDFMGSVDWTNDEASANHMEKDEAENIMHDLEAAEAPAKNEINMGEMWASLKNFMEKIGCTNVKIENL